MSVYIKGMEMPTSCRTCRFCNGQANTDYGVCAWCNVDGKARDAYTMQDCPLISVPDHGRLIDADALHDAMYHRAFETDGDTMWQSGCWVKYRAIENVQNAAPTIIPADKEE